MPLRYESLPSQAARSMVSSHNLCAEDWAPIQSERYQHAARAPRIESAKTPLDIHEALSGMQTSCSIRSNQDSIEEDFDPSATKTDLLSPHDPITSWKRPLHKRLAPSIASAKSEMSLGILDYYLHDSIPESSAPETPAIDPAILDFDFGLPSTSNVKLPSSTTQKASRYIQSHMSPDKKQQPIDEQKQSTHATPRALPSQSHMQRLLNKTKDAGRSRRARAATLSSTYAKRRSSSLSIRCQGQCSPTRSIPRVSNQYTIPRVSNQYSNSATTPPRVNALPTIVHVQDKLELPGSIRSRKDSGMSYTSLEISQLDSIDAVSREPRGTRKWDVFSASKTSRGPEFCSLTLTNSDSTWSSDTETGYRSSEASTASHTLSVPKEDDVHLPNASANARTSKMRSPPRKPVPSYYPIKPAHCQRNLVPLEGSDSERALPKIPKSVGAQFAEKFRNGLLCS